MDQRKKQSLQLSEGTVERVHEGKGKTLMLDYAESGKIVARRTFTLRHKIGTTPQAVCYEAFHEFSSPGVLKIFTHPKEHQQHFRGLHQLLLLRRTNSDLAVFIPPFEMYCIPGESTVSAVFNPQPPLETFESICRRIQEAPQKNPEKNLVLVLQAVTSLTRCISAMHEAGLLHRDIKPANFGFRKLDEAVLYQSISLFDVDTVVPADSLDLTLAGTPLFLEPEAGYLPAGVQSDIFAIGATLFYGLIVHETTRKSDYFYLPSYYGELRSLLKESELIACSEANSHYRLRDMLFQILYKSLAPRAMRYQSCRDLLEDLNQALCYALPAQAEAWQEIAADPGRSRIWEWLEKNTGRTPSLSVLVHQMRHPLYPRQDEKILPVLILGFGQMGQLWLDACLQAAQNLGKKLKAVVISEDPQDFSLYKEERPGLDAFVFQQDSSHALADLLFLTRRITAGRLPLRTLFHHSLFENTHPFVFCALGSDLQNRQIARTMSRLQGFQLERLSWCAETSRENAPGWMLDLQEDAARSKEYELLMQLGFHVHLCWSEDLNVSWKRLRKQFLQPYSRTSSISNALGLIYRLHSIGIDLPDCLASRSDWKAGLARAAMEWQTILKKDPELLYTMSAREHNRWIFEKIAQGWMPMKDCTKAVCQGRIDAAAKQHICLAGASAAHPLFHSDGTPCLYWWQQAEKEELERLDELDRISVQMHREACRKADEMSGSGFQNQSSFRTLQQLALQHPFLQEPMMEWQACLWEILRGNARQIHLLAGLEETLVQKLQLLPLKSRQQAMTCYRQFADWFDPFRARLAMHDWKQTDQALIGRTSFILTYDPSLKLLIPLNFENYENLYAALAPAFVLAPRKLILAVDAKEAGKPAFLPALLKIQKLAGRYKLRSAIHLLIVSEQNQCRYTMDRKLFSAGKLSSEMFRQSLSEKMELSVWMKKENRNRTLALFVHTACNSYLEAALDQAAGLAGTARIEEVQNINGRRSAFQFFPDRDAWSSRQGIFWMENTQTVSLLDLEGAVRTESGKSGMDLLVQNSGLESLRFAMVESWSFLKTLMQNVHGENDLLEQFAVSDLQLHIFGGEWIRMILPAASRKAAQKVLQALKNRGIVSAESTLILFGTECLEAAVRPAGMKAQKKEALEAQIRNLFSSLCSISEAETVEIEEDLSSISFRCSRLQTPAVFLKKREKELVFPLLEALHQRGLIHHLQVESIGSDQEEIDAYQMSWIWAAGPVRDLFTGKAEIEEWIILRALRESGMFDETARASQLCIDGISAEAWFDLAAAGKGGQLFVLIGRDQSRLEHLRNFLQEKAVQWKILQVCPVHPEPAEVPAGCETNRIRTISTEEQLQKFPDLLLQPGKLF